MITISNNKPKKFSCIFNLDISLDYIKPVWTGNKWKYCGKSYSSLRLLKTLSDYKLHKQLADIMSNEIRKEIDKEILEEIRSIAG